MDYLQNGYAVAEYAGKIESIGWIMVVVGLVSTALGSLLVYYGKKLKKDLKP